MARIRTIKPTFWGSRHGSHRGNALRSALRANPDMDRSQVVWLR